MTKTTAERKRGEHRTTEESRRKILDSALKLAQDRGFHGTTMSLISKTSGMPAGSLYWHFENKDNLFSALLERGVRERDAGTGWWDVTTGETIREHLTRFILVRTGTLNPTNGFWRIGLILSLERSLESPEARAQFLAIRSGLTATMSDWWRQMLGRPTVEMDPGLPHRLSAFTMATIDGLVVSETAGETWDMEELGRTLVDTLVFLATQGMERAGASVEDPRPASTD